MPIFLFIIFILYSDIEFVYSQVCNPIDCFGKISKVFQNSDGRDSCVKIGKIENCVSLCHSATHDDCIIKGIQEVKQDICENDRDNKLYNKCVDKHKYLLLSCLYESFNINAVSSEVDPKLLMCRKISEAQHCDVSTLVTCSLHADYIAEVLLEKLLKPLHTEYCTFTNKEIYDFNVTYPVLSNDYKNLALCFDTNSHLVDDCVSNKGVKNSVISSFFSYKLCKSVDSFIDCVHKVVQNRCHSQELTFKLISHSLYQNILPKCFPFSDSNKASKDKVINDKYVDASGTHLKNSSDMVTVHQHIVINVVEHHYDGNSAPINFLSVFCIFCPFVQFLLKSHLLTL